MYLELIPTDGRKSFNGNAIVQIEQEHATLYSYNTPIASIDNNRQFRRLWNGYSATTQRHLNAFRTIYNLETITKKQWEAMPIATD